MFHFLSLGLILPLVFLQMRNHNQLVELEHGRYPEQWAKDGKPSGFSFGLSAPYGAGASRIANHICSFKWLFMKPPPWVAGDAEAIRLVRRQRGLFLVWIAAVLPLWVFANYLIMFHLDR